MTKAPKTTRVTPVRSTVAAGKAPLPQASRSGVQAGLQEPVHPVRLGDPPPRLLTLPEVCDALGCSPKTLQRRIRAGELPVIRDGRLVRVHPADLARYVAARRSL